MSFFKYLGKMEQHTTSTTNRVFPQIPVAKDNKELKNGNKYYLKSAYLSILRQPTHEVFLPN